MQQRPIDINKYECPCSSALFIDINKYGCPCSSALFIDINKDGCPCSSALFIESINMAYTSRSVVRTKTIALQL